MVAMRSSAITVTLVIYHRCRYINDLQKFRFYANHKADMGVKYICIRMYLNTFSKYFYLYLMFKNQKYLYLITF